MKKPVNHKFFENYSYYIPGMSGVLALTGLFILGSIVGNLISLLCLGIFSDMGQDYATVISYPFMFIPAMIYASTKSRSQSYNSSGLKMDSNNFGKMPGIVCAILVTFATITMAICSDAALLLIPDPPQWFEDLMKTMTQGNFFVNFLCVSIFAPFFEEWLCRGMVLRGLLGKNVKPVWAIIISAIFFAVIHLNPWQAIPAFMLGCLFGYVYYKTGSLKLTMLMHFVNNTFSLVMSNIDGLQDVKNWREVFPGASYWIILAACTLFTLLTILQFSKIQLKAAGGNMDKVPALFED